MTTPDRRSTPANVTTVTGAAAQTPPAGLLDDALRALEPDFRLDSLVALSSDRALYHAWDRVLKRPVSIRVHLAAEAPGRAWFMRETAFVDKSLDQHKIDNLRFQRYFARRKT